MRRCSARSLRPARLALLGCTALGAVLPALAVAQDAGVLALPPIVLDVEEGSADFESIVASGVSAGGRLGGEILELPATVSVVTSAEIEQRGATSVEEVLQYTAGVSTDTYGADDRFDYFRIRGFDAYQYRDGLTLGSNFGAIREEVFAFERVEVFKGASSGLFGVSDPGGSVNFVTKTPRFERFGDVYGQVGSFQRRELGFDLGDTFTEGGAWAWRATGLVRDAEREYDYSNNDEVFLMGGLAWQPDAGRKISFVLDYLDRDDVPGSGGYPTGVDFDRDTFFGEPDFNYRGTERVTATLQMEQDFGGGLSFAGTARYSDESTDFGYAYVTGSEGTFANRAFFANDSERKRAVADARLTYERTFGAVDSTTIVGVEAFWEEDDGLTYFTAAPDIDYTNPVYSGGPGGLPDPFRGAVEEQDGRAVYIQQDLDWNDRVIASGGLRYDDIDITSTDALSGVREDGTISETTGRLGLTYKITPNVSTYVSYAQSVLPAGAGVLPEEGEQVEIGAKWQPAGMNALVTAAIYDLSKTNIVRTDPVTLEPRPIGEVRVRGFDLEAKAELGWGVDLTAAYAYLDPEIVEDGTLGNAGNDPARVPNHIAALRGDYTLEGNGRRGDIGLGLGLRYTGAYFSDDANELPGEDVWIADASFRYEVADGTDFAVNVSNLFDEKYVAYGGFGADFYNPGREITATLRRSW